MKEIPNLEEIHKIEQELFEEYDLDARLSRYESMSPELIEFANENGISDPKNASHALFISDFIVTSSEVPSDYDDNKRRQLIFKIFKNLQGNVNDPVNITKLFYISYNLAIKIRRTDSFLAGRGVEKEERAMIIILLYILPFIIKNEELIQDEGCQSELGVLFAALENGDPEIQINELPKVFKISSENFIEAVKTQIIEFLDYHKADVNDNVVLPNISETKLMYIVNEGKEPMISGYQIDDIMKQDGMEVIKNLFNFISSNKEYELLYLRGRIHNGNKNIILTKNPSDYNSMVIIETPAEEVNVTELMALLQTEEMLDKSWRNSGEIKEIGETYTEKGVVEEVEWVEREVEEKVKLTPEEIEEREKEPKEPPKKKGFFGRILSIFSSSSGDDSDNNYKIVKKTVKEKVTNKVKKKIIKVHRIGYATSDSVSKSLAILSLSDLRLFEKFDTFRENEYRISGALFSNFVNDKTSFMSEQTLVNPSKIADVLDGLDEAVEKVISVYFGEGIQILPTEILFRGPNDGRFIISLDGNDERLVGTIAQTVKEDITQWQNKQEVEKFQRRTLHMRTGQLLSSLNHTPFDRSVESIYKFDLNTINNFELDHAILKLE